MEIRNNPSPVTAINEHITRDYRKVVILRAVKCKDHAPIAVKRRYHDALRSAATFNRLMRRALAKTSYEYGVVKHAFEESDEMAGAVLNLWVCSHGELYAAVRDELSRKGIAVQEAYRPGGGFVAAFTPAIAEALAAFAAEHKEFSADDATLMFSCLTGYLPAGHLLNVHYTSTGKLRDEDSGAREGAMLENSSDDVRAELKGTKWGEWLEEAEATGADAPDWDTSAAFVQCFQAIAAAKFHEREQDQGLSEALRLLIEEYREDLARWGNHLDSYARWESWDVRAATARAKGGLTAAVQRLGSLFRESNELPQQLGTSVGGEYMSIVERLGALPAQIEATYVELATALVSPVEAGEETESAEVTAVPVAPPAERLSLDLMIASSSQPTAPNTNNISAGILGLGAAPAGARFQAEIGQRIGVTPHAPSSNITPALAPPLTSEDPPSVPATPSEATAAGSAGEETRPDTIVPEPAVAGSSNGSSGGGAALASKPEEQAQQPVGEFVKATKPQTLVLPPVEEVEEVSLEEEKAGEEEFTGTNPDKTSLYSFPVEQGSQEIAVSLLGKEWEEKQEGLNQLVWRLVYENKFGLAYHLSMCLSAEGFHHGPLLSPMVIRILALGSQVLYGYQDLALLLREGFGQLLREDLKDFKEGLFIEGNKEWNQAIRLLLAAAALRPVLLAPGTYAANVLEGLDIKGMPRLSDFCGKLAAQGEKPSGLDAAALKSVKDYVSWQNNLDALLKRTEEWWSRAPKFQIGHHPALRVWQEWLSEDGLVYQLLRPVRENNARDLEKVSQLASRLLEHEEVEKEARHTDRNVLRRPRNYSDIYLDRISKFGEHLSEAVELAFDWVGLHKARPNREMGGVQRETENLGQLILSHREAVQAELDSVRKQDPSMLILTGVDCCHAVIESLSDLFQPGVPFPSGEANSHHLLCADLLKIPSVTLDDGWEPRPPADRVLAEKIIELLISPWEGWERAFEGHCEKQDHVATQRIIDYLDVQPEAGADVEALEAKRVKGLRLCVQSLERECDRTDDDIAKAFHYALLNEAKRDELHKSVKNIRSRAEETLRFAERYGDLDYIGVDLKKAWEGGRTRVLRRLESDGIERSNSEAYKRILNVLHQDDLLSANEFLDMLAEGRQLPEPRPIGMTLKSFFPGVVRDYKAMESTPALVVQKVRGRGEVCGINFGALAESQAAEAVDILDVWFTLKRRKEGDSGRLMRLLFHLGFTPRRMSQEKAEITGYRRRQWVNFSIDPVQNRAHCPSLFYGSAAGGNLRVLCVWDKATEGDLFDYVGDTLNQAPLIVFYFGLFPESARQELASKCRAKRRTFVVVDDALFLYLCGEHKSRMRALFECTLPFTFAEPYVLSSGPVPPEIFYGRDAEIDSVRSPFGSHFIYGGRRLGKTALLQRVKDIFHNPEEGKVAIWLDLKVEKIGTQRPIDDFWVLLGERLRELEDFKSVRLEDSLLTEVKAWLAKDDRRRLLLLLDEADDFFDIDGRRTPEDNHGVGGFHKLSSLKKWMFETNNRFKVVFAGLHNVLRTEKLVTQTNNPLSHLGDSASAICVGPLLGKEHDEALALIEEPLSSIGYCFASSNLPIRILSRTNYYPNLIQLYCHQLLKYLNESPTHIFDPRESPPYVITSQHVDDAYSDGLRRLIKERFDLTLQLDARYEVIANSIALKLLSKDGSGGLTVNEVRREALVWWEEGFRKTESMSESAFLALMEEMVGLGVLRRDSKGLFSLRSVNVFSIMGTKQEIENALESEHEVPLKYASDTFRSAYRDGRTGEIDPARRSPLTAQQEADLQARANGASIIFGTGAAGLGELSDFLRLSFGEKFFFALAADNFDSFSERLHELLQHREKGAVTLVFVPHTAPWDCSWVEKALTYIENLYAADKWARVVFAADPEKSWRLVSEDPDMVDSLSSRGLSKINLTPWHDAALGPWLEDCSLPHGPEVRKKIAGVTERWPLLLQCFYRFTTEWNNWQKGLDTLKSFFGLEGGESDISEDDFKRLVALTREVLNGWNLPSTEAAFGLAIEEPQRVLRVMAELHPLAPSAKQLAGLLGLPEPLVDHCIRWADLLRLVVIAEGASDEAMAGQGSDTLWQLDPIVYSLLRSDVERGTPAG